MDGWMGRIRTRMSAYIVADLRSSNLEGPNAKKKGHSDAAREEGLGKVALR